MCVTAVEVVGGEVRDLLRGGVSGDLQTIDTEEPLCQEFDRDQATPTVEDKMLKVKVNSEHDFNKLLGVITSVRSSHRALDIQRGHKLGRNSGHVVVRMGVVSEGRRWCDVVFVGLNVPQVEDCVLTGDLLEDDGGMGGGGRIWTRFLNFFCDTRLLEIAIGPGRVLLIGKKTHSLMHFL